MELLALITTCAAIIRTISFCLDAMSGGLVRIYILGRNSSINEPWPDVLGIVIVFIISGMFILGLENSKVFTVLLISGVLSISGLLAVVTYLRGNIETWLHDNLFPKGLSGILTGSTLLTISFPNNLPTVGRYPKIKAAFFSSVVLISISLISGCLSTLTQMSKSNDYETVPILRILETKDLHKLIPAIGCLYVIACSAALLEIFTESFQIILRLATSEWKILLKQISYESRDSGSPILAVFVCGSFVGILAFACPLRNMTYVIAGGQLSAGILRAFFFLYSPFRPKSMNPISKLLIYVNELKIIQIKIISDDSTQSYSRLASGNSERPKTSLPKRTSMWFRNKAVPSLSSQSLSNMISKKNRSSNGNEEVEKEWLLLGEPSSPVNKFDSEPVNAESSILNDETTSDVDCIAKEEGSDSESEEDIDSIVEEFHQKVKVSTAGLKDSTMKVPSMSSWRTATCSIIVITGSAVIASISISYELLVPLCLSIGVTFVTSILMLWIPRYTYTHETPSTMTCAFSLTFNFILMSVMMFDSWCAIIFWIFSGIILALQSLVKCDVWCCLCLDYPHESSQHSILIEESLIPNGSSSRAASTLIRLKNPPVGSSVINHVQSRR
ncbi:CLUMA_CG014212, isoform A [Clunio marinus]|uniref:CLUMA_CG014212, isoform A n=1 Tax=Clunio marinus TaxID=568069 RepID=A0A1J1IN29_9DIPT|nr:CLUMA_CG014212, isoform A [Clunio marinus]